MKYVNVKNTKNTATNPPTGYSNWLDLWEKKQGVKAYNCEAMLCNGKAKTIGCVIKIDDIKPTKYIIPLCNYHYNIPSNELFEVWESDLVPIS